MLKKWALTLVMQLMAVMTSKQFLSDVKEIVVSMVNKNNSNQEKKLLALKDLKKIYTDYAGWIINASIELVIGYLHQKYPELLIKKK